MLKHLCHLLLRQCPADEKADKHLQHQNWLPQEKDFLPNIHHAEAEDLLVGHIPCEISKLIHCFLKTDKFNSAVATVTKKQKREMGLVVPVRFKCMAKKKTFANILHKELVKKKNKYNYFELNVLDFVDKKKIEYF